MPKTMTMAKRGEFGRRLIALRLEFGFETMKDASEAAGVSYHTWASWEEGRKRPNEAYRGYRLAKIKNIFEKFRVKEVMDG